MESIEEIVKMSNITSTRRNVVIKSYLTHLADNFPFLLFDKRRLQQVLINLLSNAQKFQSYGTIDVSAEVLYKSIEDEEFLLRVKV